jgi:hypothetical protein
MRLVLVCALTILVSACGANEQQSMLLGGHPSPSGPYPLHPDEDKTPGKLCQRPNERRYPEGIAYCKRNVDSSLKRRIIADYDESFGYSIGSMQRSQFKIDHYIPLCMGGGNEQLNLWPQHQSVFSHTDPIEQKLCELMARGLITQAQAVVKIKYVKFHLEESDAMIDDLDEQLQDH